MQPKLHQTAIEGQSRQALRPSAATASPVAGALETHAFPTPALQDDKLTLRKAGSVSNRLDVRAASGQGLLLPIFQLRKNAEPGRGLIQSDEVGNAGAQMHPGIAVPNVEFLAASLAALVPGVPPLGL